MAGVSWAIPLSKPVTLTTRGVSSSTPRAIALRNVLAQATEVSGPLSLDAASAPWHVGLTPYFDAKARRLFIDVNNTDIDLAADTIAPTQSLAVAVTLPPALRGAPLQVRVLSPDGPLEVLMRPLPGDRVEIEIPPIPVYACVVIEGRR